jgi:hypothetical protein
MSVRSAVLALGAMLVVAVPAAAQSLVPAPRSAWALRSTTGGFIPTGDLRRTLENGQSSGAQLAYRLHPAVILTGSFSWARSRDLATASAPKLDVFTSDVGVELCPKQWIGERFTLNTFAGLGAGDRSYNYRKLAVDATHNLAGYVATGGEMGFGRLGLRLEVRDYLSGFKPLAGVGSSETRNDVVIMAGLRYHRKQS